MQGKVTDKVRRWLMESTNSVTLEIMAFELLENIIEAQLGNTHQLPDVSLYEHEVHETFQSRFDSVIAALRYSKAMVYNLSHASFLWRVAAGPKTQLKVYICLSLLLSSVLSNKKGAFQAAMTNCHTAKTANAELNGARAERQAVYQRAVQANDKDALMKAAMTRRPRAKQLARSSSPAKLPVAMGLPKVQQQQQLNQWTASKRSATEAGMRTEDDSCYAKKACISNLGDLGQMQEPSIFPSFFDTRTTGTSAIGGLVTTGHELVATTPYPIDPQLQNTTMAFTDMPLFDQGLGGWDDSLGGISNAEMLNLIQQEWPATQYSTNTGM
ncbi:uncharacterized protein PgNI_12475 [Pyricularia grisea]|uniref:Uncharacterized protein n=1 Tax=Pyricularia grisea TaxID=148305 RepID=A0A6P8AML1_PYRGI|nr:uncharacterized protein PgNI_12475 [Pyricularia grisea]TLD03254.1 hypothetical protein PgNI_12475 [Pyricularia grisea]